MKKVIPLVVGQLSSNCYIYNINTSDAIIIDPGDDAEYIIQKLLDLNLTPKIIIATHGHFDHIMAGFTIQAAYNCPFYIDSKDEFLCERMRDTAKHFGEVDPGPAPIISKSIDTKNFEIIKTPGHTPGSVSYYFKKDKVVFVGDLMFGDGSIGEVTHRYSNREDIKRSIKKIIKLPGDTLVYPGHGECQTVKNLITHFKWVRT